MSEIVASATNKGKEEEETKDSERPRGRQWSIRKTAGFSACSSPGLTASQQLKCVTVRSCEVDGACHWRGCLGRITARVLVAGKKIGMGGGACERRINIFMWCAALYWSVAEARGHLLPPAACQHLRDRIPVALAPSPGSRFRFRRLGAFLAASRVDDDLGTVLAAGTKNESDLVQAGRH